MKTIKEEILEIDKKICLLKNKSFMNTVSNFINDEINDILMYGCSPWNYVEEMKINMYYFLKGNLNEM